MNVISLTDEALYELASRIVQQMKEKSGTNKQYDKWVDGDEAMRILRITSKTTLQKWRDEGKIRFSQPEKKIILYDSDSLLAFLDKHAKNPF